MRKSGSGPIGVAELPEGTPEQARKLSPLSRGNQAGYDLTLASA